MQIAAEIFGEDLQLSLLSKAGGLALVPRRLFEHSPHREGRQILSVMDFVIPATVTLVRSAMPRRFDPAVDRLANALTKRLEGSSSDA